MLDENHLINISNHNDSLLLTTGQNSFTLFDFSLNKEIKDSSAGREICKIFADCLFKGDLNGFEKYANAEMQKVVFNSDEMNSIMTFWDNIVSQAGKCTSISICDKNEKSGSTSYSLTFHLGKAEVLMQISFNENSLINGFYILKIIPRCNVYTVRLIPTGNDEYFVDGYSYGGYKDFRITEDKRAGVLRFESWDETFTALRCR